MPFPTIMGMCQDDDARRHYFEMIGFILGGRYARAAASGALHKGSMSREESPAALALHVAKKPLRAIADEMRPILQKFDEAAPRHELVIGSAAPLSLSYFGYNTAIHAIPP